MDDKLEECLLDNTKVEKVVSQAKRVEEASGEKSIPTNQGDYMSFKEDGNPKDNKGRLGPIKSDSKEKKKVKEKVCEKSDQKYEPPHKRRRK